MAIGAGAVGTVEGEQTRRELLHHRTVFGAGEVFGIEALALHTVGKLFAALGHHLHQGQAIAALEGRAQRIGQALLDSLTGHQAIHHHFDVVGLVFIELDVVGELAHLAVDAHPRKSLSHQAADQLGVGALLAPHQRSQQLIPGALRQQQDLIDHLVDRLGADRPIALGAMGFTRTAKQQPQVVLNLRNRANGGTGVMAGGLLINRDGRR